MKIAVLDGSTLNPGDLSWDGLAALGELTVYDRTFPEQLEERLEGVEIALTNKTVIPARAIENAKALKFISIMATGFNIVDIEAARERGIPVSNAPSYSTDAVAQMAIALILETALHVGEHNRAVQAGRWVACPDYCFWDYPLVELAGKTLGVLGCGAIGRRTARIAAALGMEVLGYSRRAVPGTTEDGIRFVTLPELFARSQYLTLHCPLNAESENIVNADTIASMPRGAVIVNTARGGCVDSPAVADALRSGQLRWYCADVSAVEPQSADDPLLAAPNCILTPHIAWAAYEARVRLMEINAANVRAFLEGAPVNVVN